jgi:methionyl-tRNA formyltransferase
LAADNLESVLKKYLTNPVSLQIQDHSQKTYFPKLTKDSGKIDWSKPAEYNQRFIRAMQPWPIAWTWVKNPAGQTLRLQIFTSKLHNAKIEPLDVKVEGKSPTQWSAIQKHYQILHP